MQYLHEEKKQHIQISALKKPKKCMNSMLLSMLLKLNTSACKFESVVRVCVYSFLLPLKLAFFLNVKKGAFC